MFEDIDLDEIKWWFADNWQKIIGVGLVVLFLIVGALAIHKENNRGNTTPNGLEAQIEYMMKSSETLQNTFSLLETRAIPGTKKGAYNAEYTLFLKEPFISSGELESALDLFISTIKVQKEVEGLNIRALKFNIYDRHICYMKGYPPKGTYVYTISYKNLPEKYKEEIKNTRSGVSTSESAMEYALNKLRKVDYTQFDLTGMFTQLTAVPGVEPLTDQEYDWFVKLDQYRALGGDYIYLAWELGIDVDKDTESVSIGKEFDTFVERLHAIGDNTTNYPQTDLHAVKKLQDELVVQNPSLLLYSLDGIIDENEITARRKIIEKHPGDFDEVVKEWIETKAGEALELQRKQATLPKETPLNDKTATPPTEEEVKSIVDKETGHDTEENKDTQPEENEDTQPDAKGDTQPKVSEESGQE